MGQVGRPAKKTGKKAAAQRLASRKSYNSKSVAERKALVQNRDKEAQRKADAKRYAKSKSKRDEYRKEQMRAKRAAPPKPKTCQWPGCKNTTRLQWHHQGSNDRYLCPTHHAEARRRAK